MTLKCLELRSLVLASRCSWNITGLGVCLSLCSSFLLNKHLSVRNIGSYGVLVSVLTGENSGSIRGVSLKGLVGVEVSGGTRGVRVPLSVNIVLSFGSPHFLVILSVLEGDSGGSTSSKVGRSESGSSGKKCEKAESFGELEEMERLDYLGEKSEKTKLKISKKCGRSRHCEEKALLNDSFFDVESNHFIVHSI